MGLGVLVMVLAAFGFVPLFLANILEWSIWFLNKVIHTIASLEEFIFREIPFHWQFLCSAYFLIIASILWFQKPNFKRLALALISVIVLQLVYFSTHWTIRNQSELVVFHSKKNSLITIRKGKNITVYSKDSVLKKVFENKSLAEYSMANFSNLTSRKQMSNLMYCNGNKILIVDSLGVYPKNIRPDIVVLTQSPKINLERFLQIVQPKVVVADASNFKNIQKLWKATCLKQKIPFHATAEKGFYRLN